MPVDPSKTQMRATTGTVTRNESLGDFAREIGEKDKRRFMVGNFHGNKEVSTPLSM